MSYTGWYEFGDVIRKSEESCLLYRSHFLSCGRDLECVLGGVGDKVNILQGCGQWVDKNWGEGEFDYALTLRNRASYI
jgi:hypothetical protein